MLEEVSIIADKRPDSTLPTLAQLRRARGDGGVVNLVSPFSGLTHEVSLGAFDKLDPETTRVAIEWTYYGDSPPKLQSSGGAGTAP